jgi:3-oxoacyl-[acyl-carrier-protein] synthase-3
MTVYLHSVAYHLPEKIVTNEDLVRANPSWNADSLFRKTGIRQRHIAKESETSLDFAERTAEKLFRESGISACEVDVLLFCTQTPDYMLPASACVLHERLQLPTKCGAFDFNLGCSGFTYGLWFAKSLVDSGSAKTVLLLVGDTLSRECAAGDQVTVPIFGDGAGGALVCKSSEGALAELGTTVVGTDGRGWRHLKMERGGSRCPVGNRFIEMNGAEIFNFTLTSVEDAIGQLLSSIKEDWGSIDRMLLHQANGFILETLRRRMNFSPERCPIDVAETGNTSSASLPVLFRRCFDRNELCAGQHCVLAGYGVGYSWAITSIKMLRGNT